jgi:hypothetical protein
MLFFCESVMEMDTGVKRPGREADLLPPSSPRLRMRGAMLPFPNEFSWRGALLSTGTTLPLT